MQVSSIPEKVESVGQRRSTQKKKQKRSAVPPATPILLVSTPQANHEVSTEQQQKKQRTRPMSLHATTPSTTDRNERQGNARGTEFKKNLRKPTRNRPSSWDHQRIRRRAPGHLLCDLISPAAVPIDVLKDPRSHPPPPLTPNPRPQLCSVSAPQNLVLTVCI